MKKPIIEEIIGREWEMFSNVSNAGGRAACQLDPVTFGIMRRSQAVGWPEDLLESYREDLAVAQRDGRNLMSEKYARMMESTVPREYAAIADRLPGIDGETLRLIEEIVAINVQWKEEAADRYPILNSRGRPIHAKNDTAYATSFETYLKGELKTYSPTTIRLLHKHTLDMKKNGLNEIEANLLNQVKQYGYASLNEAEGV
ncbi:MAG: DUF4125 family protein [Solidesulfovibrio sp.]|uniref:DUF4125 family protein n=1 Tax=Solidesulfovibrio sp. TaxID=2910990 RepID=UPI003158A35F